MKANLLKNLFTLISVVSLTSTVSAQVVLLGGFAGTSPTAIQSPSISNINVTLTSPTISGVPTDGFSQINNTLWGSTALDVVAPTIGNGDDSRKAVIQEGTNTPWTLILQITNNGTLDLSLNQIHFLTKKDINNAGPRAVHSAFTFETIDGPRGSVFVQGLRRDKRDGCLPRQARDLEPFGLELMAERLAETAQPSADAWACRAVASCVGRDRRPCPCPNIGSSCETSSIVGKTSKP
jgi:hypothetical protein